MADKTRKEIMEAYKNRVVTGGVYVVRNSQNKKALVMGDTDLKGAANRYAFAKQTGGCFHPRLQKDLTVYGKDVFSFEVLEEIEKKPDQTDADFACDVRLLEQMWREKFEETTLY